MTTQTSTGTLFAISASSAATIDSAGFGALSYTTVGEITDIAEIGADTAVVNHNPLATGITEKFKGFTNYGSSSVSFARDTTDAGQILLNSGATGANKNLQHAIRITYQDGSIDYFHAKIFSFKITPGSSDAIVGSTSSIEIESEIVEA